MRGAAQAPSTLAARLRERIRERGPISFAEYMDAALYHPADGFYARAQRLGARGAFATAPTSHRAFAGAVEAELRAAHAALGGPSGFAVIEVGPGNGALARALAPAVAELGAELILLERAAGMREAQREALQALPARWIGSPEELRAGAALVVANEVLDDLACHLLEWPDEVLVDVDTQGRFVEAPAPAREELRALVLEAGVVPEPGARYAVRPQAPAFLSQLASMFEVGRLLVVDYGGEGSDLHRGKTPVRTFVGGRRGGDPLAAPGTQNITADVDFSALRRAARALGLHELRYEPQTAWLRGHGSGAPAPDERTADDWSLAALLASSEAFRVLLLERSPEGGACAAATQAPGPGPCCICNDRSTG